MAFVRVSSFRRQSRDLALGWSPAIRLIRSRGFWSLGGAIDRWNGRFGLNRAKPGWRCDDRGRRRRDAETRRR